MEAYGNHCKIAGKTIHADFMTVRLNYWPSMQLAGLAIIYRFDTNCQMQTGWVLDNGLWYYLQTEPGREEGKMVVGWIKMGPNGPWYWCNDGKAQNLPYGAMLADGVTPDGYAVAADGKWIQ